MAPVVNCVFLSYMHFAMHGGTVTSLAPYVAVRHVPADIALVIHDPDDHYCARHCTMCNLAMLTCTSTAI